MQYEILEQNMERLEKKLIRICNKCRAYGCSFSYRETGEVFREVESEYGDKQIVRFIIIEVEGTAIVNGWEFAATIDHTEKGNIIRAFSDIEIPDRYRTTAPICEHCNSNRRRKFTYLIRNSKTGEFRQVGKSCLNDYTHGMSAEFAAQYISFFDTLIEGHEPFTGGYDEDYIDTQQYLKFAAETIRCFGYVKADEEGWTTSNRALCYYELDRGNRWSYISLDDAKEEWKRCGFDLNNSEQKVADALAWIREGKPENTYLSNLQTACMLQYSPHRNTGILASLFPAYYWAMKRKEEKEKRDESAESERKISRFMGQPGDRIIVEAVSVRCVTSWMTDYGESHMYKITDGDGNVYIWKTQKELDTGNNRMILSGRIKAHTEFSGVKQTEITRCCVSEPDKGD